jgi:glutathione S-transferase
VAQTDSLDLIRVYRIPFSTNVERVSLAAGHKGIPIDWVDVDPNDRSPVTEVSGQELVPVLVHGQEIIFDSPVILDWLEERVPEPPLYPPEPARRAEVAVFVQWFNRVWKIAPNRLVDGHDDTLAAELQGAVGLFESLLDGRDYLFGAFGIADITAFPFLKYPVFGAPAGDSDPFHRILVEHMTLAERSPLRAWARRVDEHPRS